jgi:hypothetical protein
MKLHGVRPALAVAVFAAAVLAACGGGGGGSGAGTGGPPPVTTPTPPPPPTGYTAPTGAITLMSATSSGVFGSALTAGSADGLETAEVPTTPTTPPNGGSLTQYTATVKATAGIGTSSVARSPESTRALRALIAENRQRVAEDGLRERQQSPSATRALLRSVTAVRSSTAQRSTHAAPGTVGQQRQFKILTSNIGNSGGCAGGTTSGTYVCFSTITATLAAVGNHANVWVENTSLNTAGEFPSGAGDFQTIAQRFDSYYTIETSAFGPAFYPSGSPIRFQYSSAKGQCDAGGNPLPQNQWKTVDLTGNTGTSVDIVITDALAGTGEGGYYDPADEFPQQLWDCGTSPRQVSNETSMFVITGNNYGSTGAPVRNEGYWLNTDVPRSVSHELQHLLHSHYKYFRPISTGTGTGSLDDAFVDEGCSMLAEDLATDPAPGQHIDTPRYSYLYLLEPSLFSLTSFTGFQPNPSGNSTTYGWYSNTPGSYGQAYLFMRYLYDRFGPSALTTIYNTPGPDGTSSSPPAVSPVLAAGGGESYAQLYREFATAVSAQNTSAAAAPYTFSSAVVLRGNVDVPSVRTGAQSTRHLGFAGPQPPETFSSTNVPNGVLAIGPGTTATTFIVDGGILYLPSSNGGTGTTITVTAPGAPSLEGSLIQGTLPTPAPSST